MLPVTKPTAAPHECAHCMCGQHGASIHGVWCPLPVGKGGEADRLLSATDAVTCGGTTGVGAGRPQTRAQTTARCWPHADASVTTTATDGPLSRMQPACQACLASTVCAAAQVALTPDQYPLQNLKSCGLNKRRNLLAPWLHRSLYFPQNAMRYLGLSLLRTLLATSAYSESQAGQGFQ